MNDLLADGYAIVGYSATLSALGIITNHVLLQKGTSVVSYMVAFKGGKEFGRATQDLA